MSWYRPYIIPTVLVILALVCQGLLSDAITIGNATPNFFVAFALIIAALMPTLGGVVVAFVLGLLYNLLCGGVVGSMALVLTLLAAVCMVVFNRVEQQNFLFSLVVLLILGFLAEVLYGLMTGSLVSGISVSQALTLRALPCGLYDALITCLLYPLPLLGTMILNNGVGEQKNTWKM